MNLFLHLRDFQKNYSLPIKVDNKFESTILNSIKAHIALQLFNENIFYRIINQTDPFVNRAIFRNKKIIIFFCVFELFFLIQLELKSIKKNLQKQLHQ